MEYPPSSFFLKKGKVGTMMWWFVLCTNTFVGNSKPSKISLDYGKKVHEYETIYVLFFTATERNTLHEKFLYLEFFWSIFSRIRTEYGEIIQYLSVLSLNAGKYAPEKLRIWALFTQRYWECNKICSTVLNHWECRYFAC